MKRWVAALSGAVLVCGAMAEEAAQPAAPAERSMRMTEAVTAADFQQIEGGPLLIAAYAMVWGLFFAAVLYVFWRIRKVEAEIRKLEARLAGRPPGDVLRKGA
jgi:hypothetical protein